MRAATARREDPPSAPALIDAGKLHIRDAALRSELEAIARIIRQRHPGATITPSGLARELLWHALRDERLRAKLTS